MWRRWIDANRRFLDAQMDVLADFLRGEKYAVTEEEDVQKFKLPFVLLKENFGWNGWKSDDHDDRL